MVHAAIPPTDVSCGLRAAGCGLRAAGAMAPSTRDLHAIMTSIASWVVPTGIDVLHSGENEATPAVFPGKRRVRIRHWLD